MAAGLSGVLLAFIGLAVAGLLPPPSPNQSPQETAAFFQNNTNAFRVGTVLLGFGAALIALWTAVVARRVHEISGHGPVAAYCFLGLGMLLMLEIVLPVGLGQVVAFRVDRPASDTELLSDLFFILLISPSYLLVVQAAVMAAAILADRSAIPAFPRWTGYACLWVAAGSFTSVLIIFFKTGPFAWAGLFGFWIPFGMFGVWIGALSAGVLMHPAGRLRAEAASAEAFRPYGPRLGGSREGPPGSRH